MTQPPGPAPQADPPADVAGSSVGELMSNVMKDVSTLLRQEVELAKAETKAEAAKAAKGAGMVGGAGFAGYMVVLFLSVALWQGLENVLDGGWAALIVAALWLVVGAVLYATGRSEFRRINPKPERTVETLQRVPDALKGERS
ncbi:phage holin family protein [Amycolatopsis sp. NBC_01488]|uniref:phage holin family protein n=1 Tax=Amycolatopsis sp. NBC_01488 TaxID=2903563 RepID=UPI002E2B79A7|nr:phage holin family protein [Amycolatopsis sp. NBC_01488]